jgi:hypothetical protein
MQTLPSRPNKSLQPTPTAVMPPAAQEITPAVGVAEHKRSASIPMSMNHVRAREIQRSIAQVLYEIWDPLSLSGIAPRDEYDSYVGRVYRALSAPRSHEHIVAELRSIEREYMGVAEPDVDRLRIAADALLALNVAIEQ